MAKRDRKKARPTKRDAKSEKTNHIPVPKSTLNYKQQLFVVEYLIDLNATQAAIRAGYSKRTAQRTGSENLSKPLIKAAIDTEIEKRKAAIGMTAEEVVKELALLGTADIGDYLIVGDDGSVTMKTLDQLPEGRSRCIRKIRERRVIKTIKGTKEQPDGEMLLEQTVEYELWDKVKSLELLAKHYGMLVDKHEDVTKSKEPRDLSDEEIDKLLERGRSRRLLPGAVVANQGIQNSRSPLAARLQ